METNPQTYERIERYLLDKMDYAERKLFEEELDNDPNMRKELDNMDRIFQGIEIASLKSVLQDIHKGQQSSQQANTFRWAFGIAAALIVLVAAIWFFNNRAHSPASLFNKYYVQDHGLPSQMGVAGNQKFENAMVEFKRGNYQKALASFQGLRAQKPENDTLDFYMGAAKMGQEDYDEAIQEFSKVDEAPRLQERAQWYSALAYLKKGEIVNARGKLDSIAADPGHPYSRKAKEILPQLPG